MYYGISLADCVAVVQVAHPSIDFEVEQIGGVVGNDVIRPVGATYYMAILYPSSFSDSNELVNDADSQLAIDDFIKNTEDANNLFLNVDDSVNQDYFANP